MTVDATRHTELNLTLVGVLTALASLTVWYFHRIGGGEIAWWPPVAIIAFCALWLLRTVVEIGPREVEMHFTLPWPNRRIDVDDVETIVLVKIPWWVGFGYRYWPPGRACWRGEGRRAVVFQLKNAKQFWIGCRHPEAVAEMLRSQPEWARLWQHD